MSRLVNLLINEKFILALIVLNAATIFVQGFERADSAFFRRMEGFDNWLTVFFLVEAALKLWRLGPGGYFRVRWNLFDFALVVMALPSLAVWIFKVSWIDLDYLLAFRVLRVFKFFRVLRFIPDIDHLLRGVVRAVRSSVIIFFAFFVLNFIISILSFSFYRDVAPEHFSDPLMSLYSTFRVFTVEGWYEIPDAIADRSTPLVALFTRIYFVALLFGGGVIGLSLINSIFVDNMLSDNTEELEKQVARIEAKLDRLLAGKESGPDD